MRILLAVKPIDFRKGIDGLSRLCRIELKTDPFAGHMFVFRNRRKTAIKILTYDGQGFWVCQKRLSNGRFKWWPAEAGAEGLTTLQAHELLTLLWNGNPAGADTAPMWKRIAA